MFKLSCALAVATAFPVSVFAADLLVPQDFDSIQAAIDAAGSGDRVLVAPGVYPGQIDFLGKSIVVEATGGADETILDAGFHGGVDGPLEVGFVVTITDVPDKAVLRGFTITGGQGEAGSAGAGAGGGMFVENSVVVIDGCVFSVNSGITGGAIFANEAELEISDSIFEGNYALNGGAIYAEQTLVSVSTSTFVENMAMSNGGAIALFWLSQAILDDVAFFDNSSKSLGGAIFATHATLNGNALEFMNNGFAEPIEHPNGDVVGQVFSTFGGGGIYATSSSGLVNASRFTQNTAYAGSAIYIAGGSTDLEFVNMLATGNNSALGTVYCNSASPAITNCTIAANDGFGVFTTFNSFPKLNNTIVAGHSSVAYTEIAGNGQAILSNSLISGSVFSADVDEASIIGPSPMLDENFAPMPGSPVIDAGDNALVPAEITTDLLGNDRFFDALGGGAIVDIGAIEFGSAPGGGTPPAAAVERGHDTSTVPGEATTRREATSPTVVRQR